MLRALVITFGSIMAFGHLLHVQGQEKSVSTDTQHEKLLRQLRSGSYEDREDATIAILELGEAARPWVLRGTLSSDLEVRLRCEQLLNRIDSAAFTRRLDEFRIGRGKELTRELPCCREFLAVFGNDELGRALYCDTAKSEQTLLELVEQYLRSERESDKKLSEAERRAKLTLKSRPIQQALDEAAMLWTGEGASFRPNRYLTQPSMRVETLSACVLIAQLPGLKDQKGIVDAVYGFFRSPANISAIRKSHHFLSIRTGAAKWLASSEVKLQPLSIAMRLGISDVALELGRKAVDAYNLDKSADAEDASNVMMSGTTLGVIACGRFGDKSDIDRLAPLLSKQVVIQTWITVDQKTSTGQLRDLALAYSAHLAGIDPKEIGFTHLEANAETVFAPFTITFLDDAQREAAHQEWERRQSLKSQGNGQKSRRKASEIP